MKILGIMWEENSTAALVVDGKVVASVSQERFSRIKNDERYPKDAIDYVLQEGGINPGELDAVAFIGTMWGPAYILTRRYSTFSVADSMREQKEYWYPIFYEGKQPDYFKVFKEKLDLNQYPGNWNLVLRFLNNIQASGRSADKNNKEFFQEFRRSIVAEHLGIRPSKIQFIDHSTGHAMYAYFASPIRSNALVLTADAWGDNVNASINVVKKGILQRIFSSNDFKVAHFYRYITLLLGMKPSEHEYKVMGLAPYAKEKYFSEALRIFEATQEINGLGFRFKEKPKDSFYYFKDKLFGIRFDSIAGGLQAYTETILLQWIKNALAKTHMKDICFAGGVAMNVKANMRINRLPTVRSLFINPSPGDESQSMGAAFAVIHDEAVKAKRDPRKDIQPLRNAYLGPAIEDEEIGKLILQKNLLYKYKITKQVKPEKVAKLLSQGKIIGRAAGRSEFGARALGNRSILADPRNPAIIKIINEKVKNRDFWMPFAATILEKRAHDYLIDYKTCGAPYMTLAFETTLLAQRDLKAGLHPSDDTCRPQVLRNGENPNYEKLILAFEKITGVGGLLNTSFNLHGEPIVQTAADAYRVFQLSQIDCLLLNDILIEKKG